MARLKVFTWSDGLHDFTVAAPSRPKALEAWGVGQDLFKTGLAREAPDATDAEAALAQPGVVLERARKLDIPAADPTRRARRKPTKASSARPLVRPPTPPAPSPRDLKRVRDLEAELAALERDHRTALRDLEGRRAELEREARRLAREQDKARARLQARLEAARARL